MQSAALAPGGTLLIHLREYMAQISNPLNGLRPALATKCVIRSGGVFFSDGMSYNSGRYSVREVEHPGRFKSLGEEYFPGDATRYLPRSK